MKSLDRNEYLKLEIQGMIKIQLMFKTLQSHWHKKASERKLIGATIVLMQYLDSDV